MTEKKRYFYDSKQVAILKDGEFWLDGQIDTACNHSEICNDLNQLVEENEQLKQELFESEKEYLIETYSDNSVRKNDKIHSLKKEFKERFGRDFE